MVVTNQKAIPISVALVQSLPLSNTDKIKVTLLVSTAGSRPTTIPISEELSVPIKSYYLDENPVRLMCLLCDVADADARVPHVGQLRRYVTSRAFLTPALLSYVGIQVLF